MAFLAKSKDEILRNVLSKLTANTPITSIGPGAIARSIAEAITDELGDLYSILDFNLNVNAISTAQGNTLDLMGQLYNTQRKSVSNLTTIDRSLGAFYFYTASPTAVSFTIPTGTRITTAQTNYISDFFTYQTADNNTFAVGQTRVYASIVPVFSNSVFTAGTNTLTAHNFTAPAGAILKCTNPKPIAASVGYEDDDSYRARIITAVRTAAGGTELACRMAVLGLSGVRDCTIRAFPYGLGSFEALVIPEDPGSATQVLVNAQNTLNTVRPVGVRSFVRQPDTVPVDFAANVVVSTGNFIDPDSVAARAQVAVLRYLNTMLVGTPLVYNQLIQYIMDSTPGAVLDIIVTNFAADGQQILRRNYTPASNTQIIPGSISVTVAVS